jgi:hypothetical protein
VRKVLDGLSLKLDGGTTAASSPWRTPAALPE